MDNRTKEAVKVENIGRVIKDLRKESPVFSMEERSPSQNSLCCIKRAYQR